MICWNPDAINPITNEMGCAFYEGPTNFGQVVDFNNAPEELDPIDMLKIYNQCFNQNLINPNLNKEESSSEISHNFSFLPGFGLIQENELLQPQVCTKFPEFPEQ